MNAVPAVTAPSPQPAGVAAASDGRGSPIPTWAMIATRFLELRKRRGLMITLFLVTVGVPTVFLVVRLILHAVAPATYGPAGGYDTFAALTAGVLYTFGFIAAAALGCTAGSSDLTDGMFRHLVVTGRSRLALYLARMPAGLAIIGPLVAVGFAVVCTVCVLAAPSTLNFNGIQVPAGLSRTELENWTGDHAADVVCHLPAEGIDFAAVCGQPSSPVKGPGTVTPPGGNPAAPPTAAQLRAAARQAAQLVYPEYARQFLSPSTSLMVETGLWLELEAAVGFLVGLGLGSLLGQRTVGVVVIIILEIILTPLVTRVNVPHLENLQRAVVGVATAHLEPGQLPLAFGGGGRDYRLTESTITAVCVILAWLIGWTALGAWRMMTRDA